MKLYVGITDYDWFRYLKALDPDELSFSRRGPSSGSQCTYVGVPAGGRWVTALGPFFHHCCSAELAVIPRPEIEEACRPGVVMQRRGLECKARIGETVEAPRPLSLGERRMGEKCECLAG